MSLESIHDTTVESASETNTGWVQGYNVESHWELIKKNPMDPASEVIGGVVTIAVMDSSKHKMEASVDFSGMKVPIDLISLHINTQLSELSFEASTQVKSGELDTDKVAQATEFTISELTKGKQTSSKDVNICDIKKAITASVATNQITVKVNHSVNGSTYDDILIRGGGLKLQSGQIVLDDKLKSKSPSLLPVIQMVNAVK